ncbi:helix-turn-helix transcriptional regulator [Croceibacterium salegens]|nr:LuxR C-terminal-related transcriptional regulator [Croceibacterium salegens]
MEFDQDEFGARLRALVQGTTVVQLRTMTMDVFAMLGLTKAYFLAPLTRDARVGRNLGNVGFAAAWERQYRERLHKTDPFPSIALRHTGAIIWPGILEHEKIDAAGKRYLEIAARYGMARGIGTACYGPNGRAGFVGASLPRSLPLSEDLMRVRFNVTAQLSFQRYCSLVRVDEEAHRLSNRELDVLQLISQGKSNSVIAELLGISPSSVDVYVRRIFAKLGVADRTSASLKAFSNGLIVTVH